MVGDMRVPDMHPMPSPNVGMRPMPLLIYYMHPGPLCFIMLKPALSRLDLVWDHLITLPTAASGRKYVC